MQDPRSFHHPLPFGAERTETGATRFRLWAPSSTRVDLLLGKPVAPDPALANRAATPGTATPSTPATDSLVAPNCGAARRESLEPLAHGWHESTLAGLAPGTRYAFDVAARSGERLVVPDPASRWNPGGVHAASVLIDPGAFHWRHIGWRGRPWHEAVIYEVHVGAFSREGTFGALEARLGELASLGITAIELMPLAAFPGRFNWGYDGVLPYAPASAYGTPEALKSLIDAAHGLGLMVLLDVVYNHFGPDGNYLHAYCPEFFNPQESTPWGDALALDGPGSRPVRDFFVHNALYWVEEYRFDGLRLDAVHALRDRSSPDLVEEIATALRAGPGREREVHLILENNRNQAHYLRRDACARPVIATAQWNDDVHHALHALLTGELTGYYVDFADRALEQLARALAEGFAFQGDYSRYRRRTRGEPSTGLPPAAFVAFLQNHDMIGNRAQGERIDALAAVSPIETAYVCLLLSPQIPLLFMGEEYGAGTPFLYFCDFEPTLARAVAEGRQRDLERFASIRPDTAPSASAPAAPPERGLGATPAVSATAPSVAQVPPPDERAFRRSILDASERGQGPQIRRRALVQRLLATRRAHLDTLAAIRHAGRHVLKSGLIAVEWSAPSGIWALYANFADEVREVDVQATMQPVFCLGEQASRGDVPAPSGHVLAPGGHVLAQGGHVLAPGAVLVALLTAPAP
jgi:maltooligosyltrehalose trehalohydrolase